MKLDEEVHSLAQELYQQKSVLIMGRGYNFATCLEGALVSPLDIVDIYMIYAASCIKLNIAMITYICNH